MDVFAHVCEALREDDFRRLRQYVAQPGHRARFSTWLVSVVRHLAIDWFRHRDGRRRMSTLANDLPPLQRRIFELVFVDKNTHLATYELLGAESLGLSFGDFLRELAATYRSVTTRRHGHLLRELGSPPPLEASESGIDQQSSREMSEAIATAMEALEPEDRSAIELYVIDELPAPDVARILGLPNAKAVYNRVYRTLAALRERLERAGIEPGDL
jgi:RNA polymerase sigma factor (sigma-70 family)